MAIYEVKNGEGIIPEGTTVIERGAFKDCEDLKSLIIPEGVTSIRDGARGLQKFREHYHSSECKENRMCMELI